MLRAAGSVLITCPSVALAHLAITGTAPPPLVLLGVAVVAAIAGITSGAASSPYHLTARLTGAQLAGHAVVYLALGQPSAGCLPAMGRGAVAGLRLAILRPDAQCAPGQFAAGPVLTTSLAVLLAGALVLLWQCATAAAGSALLGLTTRAWAAATTLRSVAALAVHVLHHPFEPLIVTGGSALPWGAPTTWSPRRVVSGALLRRGPPALTSS